MDRGNHGPPRCTTDVGVEAGDLPARYPDDTRFSATLFLLPDLGSGAGVTRDFADVDGHVPSF